MLSIEDVAQLVLIFGLILLPLLSISLLGITRILAGMYGNQNESGNSGVSWTGPERSSYIAIAAATLLFVIPVLLANDEKLYIAVRIGLQTFSIMALITANLLTGAVIAVKNAAGKRLPIVGFIPADHTKVGRLLLSVRTFR